MVCNCEDYITVPLPSKNEDFTFICQICGKTLYATYIDFGVFEISGKSKIQSPVEYADID